MKLQHFSDKGKDSFFKKFFFGTNNNNSDNLKTHEPATPTFSEPRLTELFDRIGRPHLHDFTGGNICIFGDDAQEVDNFADLLLSKLSLIHHAVEVIDAVEFSKKRQKNSSTPFLIKISGLIPSKLLQTIIQSCVTICVLKFKDNEIVCALGGRAKSGVFAREIINSFGGDRALRELMVASLARDEFLLIENTCFDQLHDTEAVRCFQTIFKQLPPKNTKKLELQETSSRLKSLHGLDRLPCSQRITGKG
jgi:hypothetical protein